jgi:thioredoxin reductase (NADPH)
MEEEYVEQAEPAEPEEKIYDVIIIGAGPSGSTAAIYTQRSDLATLIIDKGVATGALGMANRIANFPGVPGTIPGDELLERMREQAESFGAKFVQERVLNTSLEGEVKYVFTNQGGVYQGRAVIIATGSMGRTNTVPGEERLLGRGVSYCATCDAAFFRDQDVAVAGDNEEALEEALFLTKFANRVYLLARGSEFSAPPELVTEATNSDVIEIHYNTRLREILGEDEVTGVRIAPRGGDETTLDVTGAFVYLQGSQPITDFLDGQVPLSEDGCVEVDDIMQTAIDGVFAVGDVLCKRVKQVVIACAEGATAAVAVERYLSGRENLRPDWKH